MGKSGTQKLPFSQIEHVGIVVRDIDKTIEYYSSLGIGPFEQIGLDIIDRKIYGKPSDYMNLIKVAQVGPVKIQLIQPVRGESVQKKFLETRGEGVFQLNFLVDNLEKEVAKLAEKGINVIQSGRHPDGSGFAIFDTNKIGGVTLELIQPSSK